MKRNEKSFNGDDANGHGDDDHDEEKDAHQRENGSVWGTKMKHDNFAAVIDVVRLHVDCRESPMIQRLQRGSCLITGKRGPIRSGPILVSGSLNQNESKQKTSNHTSPLAIGRPQPAV